VPRLRRTRTVSGIRRRVTSKIVAPTRPADEKFAFVPRALLLGLADRREAFPAVTGAGPRDS
jgi:hypothetical protein